MNQQAASSLRVIPTKKNWKNWPPSKVRFFASSFILNRPKSVFGCFFQMEGLRTATVALNDQGVPFRQFRHPTWLYSDKKYFPPKFGPKKGTFLAKTGPFGAPGGPEEGRHQANVCGNHVTNPVGPRGSSWDQIWPLSPSEDLRGPKKGLLGPKRALLGAPGVP